MTPVAVGANVSRKPGPSASENDRVRYQRDGETRPHRALIEPRFEGDARM